MSVQEIALFRLAPARHPGFADPDWRGMEDGADSESQLRPLSEIHAQMSRLAGWIAAGGDYGWLGDYQARRAAFELQSVRAQIEQERAGDHDGLPDDDRRAVQARLNRLQACLEAARGVS
jgi:hypothetical protein